MRRWERKFGHWREHKSDRDRVLTLKAAWDSPVEAKQGKWGLVFGIALDAHLNVSVGDAGSSFGPTMRDVHWRKAKASVGLLGGYVAAEIQFPRWMEDRHGYLFKVAMFERKWEAWGREARAQGCEHMDRMSWPKRERVPTETVAAVGGRVAIIPLPGSTHCYKCNKRLHFSEETMRILEIPTRPTEMARRSA